VNLIAFRPLADHHNYDPADIESLLDEARKSDAMLLTTEKDWVKIEQLPNFDPAWPIAVAELSLRFMDDPQPLLNKIHEVASGSVTPGSSSSRRGGFQTP
jgi:tetraacyldisaccharide-1-P 4'-kinase